MSAPSTPDAPATVTLNGEPLRWQTNRFGERVLQAVNHEAFDKLGAVLTLQEAFRGELQSPDTLYIVAGSDSGHLIRHVQRQPRPAGTRYLFVEPPEVHRALRDEGLLADLPDHIRCAPADAWLEAARALQLSDYLYINGVTVVFSLAARSSDAAPYTELGWNLREAVNSLHWRTVASRGSEAFVACQLDNVADNVQSAQVWRGKLQGRTGVLLAGGPSLDEALDWVRQHRDRLVVLAVSRISGRLQQVGLEPDFVFSVDPTDLSYEISRDMLRFGSRVIFIHQYHVHPRLLAQWSHRSYYLGRLFPWSTPLNPPHPLHGVGPTVTNTALHFAAEAGLSTLILAGVDLCFTPEGFTHAQGSNERKAGPRFDLTSLEVETYDGRRASTTADFAAALETLEQQAQQLLRQGLTLINAAPGAARVPSIAHRPLQALQPDLQPIPPAALALDEEVTPPARLKHLQRVERELQHRLQELATLQDQLRHARRVSDKLFDDTGTIRNRNLRLRLERLEQHIDQTHPDLAPLIKQCSVHALLRGMQSVRDLDSLDAQDVQRALQAYYDAYLDGAQRLRGWMERALQKVRRRRREFTATAPLVQMRDDWIRHGEAGRYLRWLDDSAHPDAGMDSASQAALQALRQAFESDLNHREGRHLARARAHGDLQAARTRMEQLFLQRHSEGLRNTVRGLQQVADAEAAAPYLALAQGLLAELEGRTDDALAFYDQVLQGRNRSLWTPALARIAHWALTQGQADTAEQALQCLADLSPRYRLQYADFLAATGRLQAAIDVYEQHLTQHPGDLDAMARLAQLMANLGATEAARLMMQHLAQQPGGAELAQALRQTWGQTDAPERA